MGFGAGFGGRVCGAAPGGGHPSLSDDGSGNVLLADGKQILGGTNASSAPHFSSVAVPTSGVHVTSFPNLYRAGVLIASATANGMILNPGVALQEHVVANATATQFITGASSTITANGPNVKISSDGVYALTTPIAATTNGRFCFIENISIFQVTTQEGIVIAGGAVVLVIYSASAAAWTKVG